MNFFSKHLTRVACQGLCIFGALALPHQNWAEDKSNAVSENEPGAVVFTPPPGWKMANSNQLPGSVQFMVVGKGQGDVPPSMNLATEPYSGTLKQYLKIVKSINDSKGAEWKDLGSIRTDAGNANLSQVDKKTQWGEMRMMHAILLKNHTIYIVTAAAPKEEFARYYKDFFQSIRSLRINKDIFELVSNQKRREALRNSISELKTEWKNSPVDSQDKLWTAFMEKINKDYSDMSLNWNQTLQKTVKDELLDSEETPEPSDRNH